MISDRHSPEAERWLIGAALVDPDVLPRARAAVTPEDFYDPARAEIWSAILETWDEHRALDAVLLHACLRRRDKFNAVGGWDELNRCTDLVVHTARVEAHAAEVAEQSQARRVEAACRRIAAMAQDEQVRSGALCERAVAEITKATQHARSEMRSSDAVAMAFWEEILAAAEGRGQRMPTSLQGLDGSLGGGLRGGQLVVLAGRPGTGKSSLMGQVAVAAAEAGYPVGVWTLEMEDHQVFGRLAYARAGVNPRGGGISPLEMDRLQHAAQTLSTLPIWWERRADLTATQVCHMIRAAQARHGIKLAIVDHLGLLKMPPGGDAVTELGEATKALKIIARELGVAVLLLVQLNRAVEKRENKRVMLSDLRGSGRIEEDADVVLAICGDHSEGDGLELGILKQREGFRGYLPVRFEAQFTRFVDPDQETDYAPV